MEMKSWMTELSRQMMKLQKMNVKFWVNKLLLGTLWMGRS